MRAALSAAFVTDGESPQNAQVPSLLEGGQSTAEGMGFPAAGSWLFSGGTASQVSPVRQAVGYRVNMPDKQRDL